MLKTVNPQTDKNKDLKPKVLNNAGDLFNEMYYIYKDKYNEEKNGLNAKKQKKLYYKKLKLNLLMIISTSMKKKKILMKKTP